MPVVNVPLVSVAESVLLNIELREIRDDFQKVALSNRTFKPELVHYISFESYWESGGNGFDLDFRFNLKVNTMDAFLASHGIDSTDVQGYMESPIVVRDSGGWIQAGEILNIAAGGIHSLRGFRVDKKTQHISFITDSSDYSMPLLTESDFALVIANSGTGRDEFPHCYFSLDPIDSNYHLHPFQQFRYGPKCLRGTDFLNTLFHTDYIMKVINLIANISKNKLYVKGK
jgi:hypothetical protein